MKDILQNVFVISMSISISNNYAKSKTRFEIGFLQSCTEFLRKMLKVVFLSHVGLLFGMWFCNQFKPSISAQGTVSWRYVFLFKGTRFLIRVAYSTFENQIKVCKWLHTNLWIFSFRFAFLPRFVFVLRKRLSIDSLRLS